MTFTSFQFFLFLPVVYLIFYFIADRWRWLVLLVASYGFYSSFKAPYLPAVLFMVTFVSYACGLRIGSHHDEAGKKRWLWIGVIACIAILAFLKYLPFLESQTNSIFGLNSTLSTTIISIGVSYFAFQAISYLADVYLEIEEPETHFGHFALYLAFFPKLLQGPIERAGDLLPQLKEKYEFNYDNMRFGMLLFTWGLFKKVVIADRLALFVNPVFRDVHNYSGITMLLAVYMYAAQIFFDFSGYTDMALGSARLFNINLTQNFNSPYLATSVADFWRRWHISFSRWILDYIFKPLQMQWRNLKNWGTATALVAAFLVSGIWHGASWGFVIWGGLHGLYMACSVFYKPFQKKLHAALGLEKTKVLRCWQIFVTFNLVSLAWIFFRANSITDTAYVIMNILKLPSSYVTAVNQGSNGFVKSEILKGLTTYDISLLIAGFIILLITYIYRHVDIKNMNARFRWSIYVCLVWSILLLGVFNSTSFVYFQF
jgi:D-alanyl-lipoteichoic acid acyltransferase DltB (MBOAT superfamily)